MRRITAIVGLLSALFAASAASAHHHGHWGGLSVNFRNDSDPRTCADLEVDADGREVARAEQKITLAPSAAPFEVQAQTNSGVVITGWEGSDYEVSVCKVAIDSTPSAADARLAQIDVRLEGRRLVTHGPDSGEWLAYLLIKTPARRGDGPWDRQWPAEPPRRFGQVLDHRRERSGVTVASRAT